MSPTPDLRTRSVKPDSQLPKDVNQHHAPAAATPAETSLATKVLENTYKSPTAIAVQAGLLLTTITIFYSLFTNPINYLFIGHPVLNSFGLIFLAQSILVTQPLPTSAAHKTMGGQVHGILNSLSAVLYMAGFLLINYNKQANNAAHITTWHARFGITTYGLLAGAFGVGIAQFWFPVEVFGSVAKAKGFYKYHRLTGYAIVVLASVTTLLSLESSYNVSVLHIPYYLVVPGLAIVVGGLSSGIKLARLGL